MSRVQIVRPEATENVCTNPSVETNLTGWASSGLLTFERSDDWQARGAWSVRAVANTVGDKVQAPTFAVVDGTQYAVTAWVRVVSGSWRPQVGAFQGAVLGVGTHRVELLYAADATTPDRFELEATVLAAGLAEAFVDAVQYEQKAGYSTTYCDGDEDDCEWFALPHASKSTRKASVRAGGRWIDVADDATIKLRYADLVGVGVPPMSHITQDLALRDGAILQRIKANPSVVTLTATQIGGTLPSLHALRRALTDLIKPNVSPGLQPMRLRYSGSGSILENLVHYVGGLEGNIPPPSGHERLSVQLVAYDPQWREERDVGTSLAVNATIAGANRVIARVDGIWRAFGTGADNHVTKVIRAPDGKVYAGGSFANIGGVAASRIAYFDPADNAWHAMGTGMGGTDPTVYDIVIGPDGKVYASGPFTTAGGITVNRVAVWDPVALTWSALGAGMNDAVYQIAWGADNNLYAVGPFTTADGEPALGVARWDGASWENVADVDLFSSATNYPWTVATSPDGKVYVGGGFYVAGGADFEDLVVWDGVAWASVSAAFTSFVLGIAFGPDGSLYATGAFKTYPPNYVARWNGLQLLALGTGLDGNGRDLDFDRDGNLYVVGEFRTAGGLKLADRIAMWNGSAWLPLPIDLPGSARINRITAHGDDLYIGGRFAGTGLAAGRTIVNNPGSADAYPVIRVNGPGVLRTIDNLTTKQGIYFEALTLMPGEQLTFDLRPGRKTLRSSFRGRMDGHILAGSDLATFMLAPGDNEIAALIGPTTYLAGRTKSVNAQSSSSTVTVNKPASAVVGDVGLVHVAFLGGSGVTITPNQTGWTFVERTDTGAAATDVSLATYRRTIAAGDPAAYTFALGSARAYEVYMSTLANLDAATPIADTAEGDTDAATVHVYPEVTSSRPMSNWWVAVAGIKGDENVIESPGWTKVHQAGASATRPRLEVHAVFLPASGDSGTAEVTTAAATSLAFHSLLLNPDAAAPQPTADIHFRPRHWGAE